MTTVVYYLVAIRGKSVTVGVDGSSETYHIHDPGMVFFKMSDGTQGELAAYSTFRCSGWFSRGRLYWVWVTDGTTTTSAAVALKVVGNGPENISFTYQTHNRDAVVLAPVHQEMAIYDLFRLAIRFAGSRELYGALSENVELQNKNLQLLHENTILGTHLAAIHLRLLNLRETAGNSRHAKVTLSWVQEAFKQAGVTDHTLSVWESSAGAQFGEKVGVTPLPVELPLTEPGPAAT